MSGVHRREFVLVSPMVDVVHQFSLRPLGRCSLTKTAGLGRYKDAASGLNRLRNSGKRNGAQGDPSNHNFTDHEYPPVLQRAPASGRLCSFFGELPSRFRLAQTPSSALGLSCRKYLRAFPLDLSSNGAVLNRLAELPRRRCSNGGRRMKPIRLTALGIIAAGTIVGAVGAFAAPAPTPAMPEASSSLVTPAYYCCWWSHGYKKCSNYCGGGKYYRPYYRPYRYRYHY